jgi:iron complex outermembrane receptor protein
LRYLLLLLGINLCLGQQPRHETVVVTGTADPLPLDEVDRSVSVLAVRDLSLVANTLPDFLRLDSSLDLQERAPNGVQSDLSIRGGSFGQTLVLLNGQRLNDAQSGHHNLDIPVPLESISRIEILRGAGSTLYGADAVGGVVNIITEAPETTELRLRTSAGSFGVNQQRGSIAAALGRFTEQLVFSRDFSSGFRPDRDYRNLAFASTTHLTSRLGTTGVVLAYGDRPFGADQFYGNFNSWENTKTWVASVEQSLGEKTHAAFSFRRHSDLFVLYRDRPSIFTNHHADESWQASLRRSEMLFPNAGLHYGVEGYRDSIASSNLGRHARNRVAAYGSADFRALHRFSLTLGVREEVYRSFSGEFSPTISGGAWLAHGLKLRGSVSHAFRIPTYTDLYYHDPANVGSPDLRPERAWNYEAGLEWNAGGKLRAGATVFERREKDGIDYVRRSAADIWRAANIEDLRFTGLEVSTAIRLSRSQQLDFHYTGLRGAQAAISGLFSKYLFNYPSHAGVASWQAGLPGGVLLRTRVGALNRRARRAYAVWDVYGGYARGRVHPFLQLTNLSDTRYEEVMGVAMPGRAITGGLEIVLR